MSNEKPPYDVVIIGGGPAGLSAAIYASWLRMKTLVLEAKAAGGKAAEASMIGNFPSWPEGISGIDLTEKMKTQALKYGAEIRIETVVDILPMTDKTRVITRSSFYDGVALIIASGSQRKRLKVLGETEFLGRGVSYCAICDGPLFRDLSVVVVGSGREAVDDTLQLADIAKNVLLITADKEPQRLEFVKSRFESKANVQVSKGEILGIFGDRTVKSIRVKDENEERNFDVSGVFIALGTVAIADMVRKARIELDPDGCVIVDRHQRTNYEGIFAAGDCTCGGMQVATAVGEGATAAMRASIYVKRIKTNASDPSIP